MCLVLYMGSAFPCRTIPWDEAAPAFHVVADDPDIERARHHFSLQYVYYLGSESGCGCGFRQEDSNFADEPEEAAQRREIHRRLRDYVMECLERQNFVELYACWSPEEYEPCEEKRGITVDQLAEESFFFGERELTIVTK